MALRTYVTSSSNATVDAIDDGEGEILETLSDSAAEGIGLQLQELLSSVADSVANTLELESQLSIEISGSVNIKGTGMGKYILINIGAEAAASTTMKVGLTTTIKPRSQEAETKS